MRIIGAKPTEVLESPEAHRLPTKSETFCVLLAIRPYLLYAPTHDSFSSSRSEDALTAGVSRYLISNKVPVIRAPGIGRGVRRELRRVVLRL